MGSERRKAVMEKRTTRPGSLIFSLALFWGATEEQLLREVTEVYDGRVVVGTDLGVY